MLAFTAYGAVDKDISMEEEDYEIDMEETWFEWDIN